MLVILLVAIGGGVCSLIQFWDWLQTETVNGVVGKESGSTTVRNVGFVIAGVVALPFAVWRSWVAHRQAVTAQQDLLNERYQQGAEMLGSKVLTVRLGGIYALQSLAMEHPQRYHIQIMQLLCAFVRHPTEHAGIEVKLRSEEARPRLREDVQDAMEAISVCHASQLEIERNLEFRLDLRNANLPDADLRGASLSGAILYDANLADAQLGAADLSGALLVRANLVSADLSGANLAGSSFFHANLHDARLCSADIAGAVLMGADLSEAQLTGANLSDADLVATNLDSAMTRDANLSGATFSYNVMPRSSGLVQYQLSLARADPANPPRLEGLFDAETGRPLVWSGQPIEDDA